VAQGAADCRSPADPRIFIIGDAAGLVSLLFGYFLKTGQVANRMGLSVARPIAEEATGRSSEPLLPKSVCHVTNSVDPLENTRIETSYRMRGDGFCCKPSSKPATPTRPAKTLPGRR
jgi:NADH dehydrogenase FAD-containing subunit